MKNFTKEELMKYNVKNGSKTYIVYKGKFYDLSGSNKWENGIHLNMLHAGNDLTGILDIAPHGTEFLVDFPIV